MINIPKQPNANTPPTWNQVGNSDVNGTLWASTGLDFSKNEGKLRLGKRILLATGSVDNSLMSGYPVAFKNFNNINFTIMGSSVWEGFDLNSTVATADAHITAGTVTITIAVPGVVTFVSHGFSNNTPIKFSTTGALPTGLVAGTIYYVNKIDSDTFSVSAVVGNTAITTSGSQSGVQSVTSLTPIVNSNYSDMEVFFSSLFVSGDSSASDRNLYYLFGSSASWSIIPSMVDLGFAVSMTVYGNKLYAAAGSNIRSVNSDLTSNVSGTYTVSIPDSGLLITFIRAASNRIWIGTTNFSKGKGYIYEWDGTSVQVTKSYRLASSGALSCVIKDDIPYVMDANGELLYWNGGTFVPVAQLNRINHKMLTGYQNINNTRFIHPNGMSLIEEKICLLINGQNGDGTNDETLPSGIWEYDETRGLTHKYSICQTKLEASVLIDFGQLNLAAVGGLFEFNPAIENGFLAGANYYADATTVKSGIFYSNLASQTQIQRAGSFITTKLTATDGSPYNIPTIKAMWDSIFTIYKKLLSNNDKIVLKYRVIDVSPVQATITWTSVTTFTVLNASVNIANYWVSGIGGEVEFLNGIGAGVCSHIINAVLAGGTWTVTLDNFFPQATGTAIARFQNWQKISSITPNNDTQNSDTISVPATWIEFKYWIQFTGKDEIERIIITNSNNLPAK